MPAPIIRQDVRDVVVDRVNRRLRKFYVNTVWGHIIYRNVPRAKWTVPYGMKTLDQFIRFHEDRLKLSQKRSDHPIALEIFYSITLTRKLTDREVAIITSALADELIDEFFVNILDLMEWGYDYEESPIELPVESRKRVSHNGEDFTEIDIRSSSSITRIASRL
jgi:hypothetical protein